MTVTSDRRFIALAREASLAAGLIGNGVTTLRKSNFSQAGLYYDAFFNLSIGLERCGKMVILLDHYFDNKKFMNDNKMKNKYGHNLKKIHRKSLDIAHKYCTDENIFPQNDIHERIIQSLSIFAKSTRYYNLNSICSGVYEDDQDPVSNWWQNVCEFILLRHYNKNTRKQHEQLASSLQELMENSSIVRHTSETLQPITSIGEATQHAGEVLIAQQWSQFYCLQICRFYARILGILGRKRYEDHKNHFIPELKEFFVIFDQPDSQLKKKKTWIVHK